MAVEKNLGIVTAYGYAKDKGYQGTEEEFAELMASYATVAQEAELSAEESEAYAVGKRNGVDVPISDETYHNNSKYYSQQSSQSASNSSQSASDALGYKNDALASKNSASQSATDALGYKNSASSSATSASTNALESEGFAVGKQNGSAVGSTSPYYHNNAEYYKNQASQSATNASTSESNASGSASSASTNALKSEGHAVGQQNGTDVASGSPYYHNNAKYYSEQAAASAASLTIDDELSTSSTNAVQNKVITEELNNKANVDGYYEGLTSGQTTQMLSSVQIEDKVPYVFRTSGGSVDIGDRETDKIIGGTVAWNQLCKNGNFDALTYWNWDNTLANVTVANNEASVTLLSATNSKWYPALVNNKNTYYPITGYNHKYLLSVEINPAHSKNNVTINIVRRSASTGDNNAVSPGFSVTAGQWNRLTTVLNSPVTEGYFQIATAMTTDNGYAVNDVDKVRNAMLIDLTQMFGSAIADYIYSLETANTGNGVEWFKSLFPKPYYAYNAGQLISVSGLKSHDMTGLNQWDEEWEEYTLSANHYIISKNFIPVLPNTTYHATSPTGTQPANGLQFYDINKNLISTAYSWGTNNNFTTPNDCYYMKFRMGVSYGTVYNNGICINLHWDGEMDGEYEPYELHSYPLDDSVTLRGLFKLDANNDLYCDGDEYPSSGEVNRRYKYVSKALSEADGTSTFTETTAYTFRNVFEQGEVYSGGSGSSRSKANMPYPYAYNTEDIPHFYIGDTNLSLYVPIGTPTSTVFEVIVEYKSPTTESADPYTNPQVVNDFGTEEYVIETLNDVVIPVGHDTMYNPNLRAKLEMAPNSPDGDGDYIVRQTNGENSYVQLVIPSELPTAPSSDGTYVLKCTVSSGTATLSWVSE